jgi:hypothetical protein
MNPLPLYSKDELRFVLNKSDIEEQARMLENFDSSNMNELQQEHSAGLYHGFRKGVEWAISELLKNTTNPL